MGPDQSTVLSSRTSFLLTIIQPPFDQLAERRATLPVAWPLDGGEAKFIIGVSKHSLISPVGLKILAVRTVQRDSNRGRFKQRSEPLFTFTKRPVFELRLLQRLLSPLVFL